MKPGKKRREEQRRGSPSPLWPSKVKKEKLGERIGELQRLVSPFGKSDTASVLQEALGYIRFLHEQVQRGDGGDGAAEPAHYLRSRGLCLVPLAYSSHLAASNGADFWSPAMGCGGDADHRLNAYRL